MPFHLSCQISQASLFVCQCQLTRVFIASLSLSLSIFLLPLFETIKAIYLTLPSGASLNWPSDTTITTDT